MDERVQKYYSNCKSKELIARDLVQKVYEESGVKHDHQVYPHQDEDTSKFFKIVPIAISDEDFDIITRLPYPGEDKRMFENINTIKNILIFFTVLAAISIIGALIMVFQTLSKLSVTP